MIDMLFRMMMDNSDFVKNLKLSSEQVEKFKNAGTSVVGTLGKFAGAIGIAGGAFATFDRLMHSTEVTADAYDSVMFQCTTSVDSFFKALASGDFSTFDDGLTGLIERAKEAYESFDQLENTIISFDRKSQQNQADFNDWYVIALEAKNKLKKNPKDKKAQEDLDDAVKHMQDIITDQESRVGTVQNDTQKTIKDIITKHTPYLDPTLITQDKYREWLDIDSDADREKLKEEYNDQYQDFLRKKFAERSKFTQYGYTEKNEKTGRSETVWYDKPKSNTKEVPLIKFDELGWVASVKEIAKDYQDPIAVYELLSGDVTDELKEIGQHDAKQSSAELTVSSFKRKLNRITTSEISTTTGGGGGGGTDTPDPYADIPANMDTIVGTQKMINDLQEKQKKASGEDLQIIGKKIQFLKDYQSILQSGDFDMDMLDELKKTYNAEDFIDEFEEVDDEIKPVVKPVIVPGSLADLQRQETELIKELNNATSNEEYVAIKAKIQVVQNQKQLITGENQFGDSIKWANDYATALNQVASAVSACNSTPLEDNSQGWTQWSTQFLSQAAAVIATYYSLAMAAGTKNAMDWPFPANLGILASLTAAVISVFASLPTFSEGGIFKGMSDFGDMNIARVNSGEMILNNRQQRNLFDLLNGGGSGGILSPQEIILKVRGQDIVGVLNNYSNKYRLV